MRVGFSLSLLIGLVAVAAPSTARAGDTFDFQYVLTANSIDDQVIQQFELIFDDEFFLGIPDQAIAYLELEIAGLTHTSPGDINIFLLPPVGNGDDGIEIMDDRGDQVAISGVTLVFADDALMRPPADSEITSGRYLPDGLGTFSQYYNGAVFGGDPVAPWRILIIDDSPGGSGSFQSITLRGNYVPEPATLSLLMLGALAMLRFRRRR